MVLLGLNSQVYSWGNTEVVMDQNKLRTMMENDIMAANLGNASFPENYILFSSSIAHHEGLGSGLLPTLNKLFDEYMSAWSRWAPVRMEALLRDENFNALDKNHVKKFRLILDFINKREKASFEERLKQKMVEAEQKGTIANILRSMEGALSGGHAHNIAAEPVSAVPPPAYAPAPPPLSYRTAPYSAPSLKEKGYQDSVCDLLKTTYMLWDDDGSINYTPICKELEKRDQFNLGRAFLIAYNIVDNGNGDLIFANKQSMGNLLAHAERPHTALDVVEVLADAITYAEGENMMHHSSSWNPYTIENKVTDILSTGGEYGIDFRRTATLDEFFRILIALRVSTKKFTWDQLCSRFYKTQCPSPYQGELEKKFFEHAHNMFVCAAMVWGSENSKAKENIIRDVAKEAGIEDTHISARIEQLNSHFHNLLDDAFANPPSQPQAPGATAGRGAGGYGPGDYDW